MNKKELKYLREVLFEYAKRRDECDKILAELWTHLNEQTNLKNKKEVKK